LLQRGENLLREVLRANGCDARTLEWSWLQNRPALRLIGCRLADEMDVAPSAEHVALAGVGSLRRRRGVRRSRNSRGRWPGT